MEILKIEDLSFTYPKEKEPCLRDISFTVSQGDFLVICGATGSGKSTLLRMLKKELAPLGEKAGDIFLYEKKIEDVTDFESASKIGYIMQNPEQQIVCDKVWHELAFGPENLGMDKNKIRRRIGEMASYFGIEPWFNKNTTDLSGGQKQLLNLAAALTTNPEILLLDEPTAMLAPIAASDFLGTLAKLNRELGITVIIIEHRLEEVLPYSNKVMALENGSIFCYEDTKSAVAKLSKHDKLSLSMPAATRLYGSLNALDLPCPITVSEGKQFTERNFKNQIKSLPNKTSVSDKKRREAVSLSNLCFTYEKDAEDILHDLSLTVYEKEIFCLLGGNGSGKTTLLNCIADLTRPYAGTIRVFGEKLSHYKNNSLYNTLTCLPQDVRTLFLRNTVREELQSTNLADFPFDLSQLMNRHPYDLSGGEQQILGLALVLRNNPKILLMDEPTKGLDSYSKKLFLDVIRKLRDRGLTLIIVTHDTELAADAADRCALLFRGEILSVQESSEFFNDNTFFTTAINRITCRHYQGVCTLQDAIAIMNLNGRI